MQFKSMSELIDWALEQNIETQALLANRAMLRCLPAIIQTKEKDVMLSGFRAGLISWVGMFSPMPLNISVEYIAAQSHVKPYSSQNALLAAREAAIATYGRKGYLRPRNAELSLADSIDALVHLESEYSSSESGIVIASNEFKNKHQIDLIALSELEYDFINYTENGLKYMWKQPLWQQSILQPIGVRQTYLEFVTQHDSTNDIWKFWLEWYQGILDGDPLDWELQREVALIPDEDWDKGPEHIAEKIEEIKARFLIDKAALSEKIEFDEEQNKFYVSPVPITNPRLLSTNLALITDALDEAMRGNGLRPDCWEDRTLRKTIERFSNDPERVEMDCMRVHRRLIAKLGDELPASDELVDLTSTLLDVALDIRANHPEIAENRAKRGAQAVREASVDEKALLEEAIPHIRAITDENLGQQIEDDIGEILEGEILTSSEELEAAIDPVIRTGSRLAKISLALAKGGALATGGVFAIAGGIVAINEAIPIIKVVWPIFLKLLGF